MNKLKEMNSKQSMYVYEKKFKNGFKFIFEIGNYIYETYDLYGNEPKYTFGFALALVFKDPKEYGKYRFCRDYIGIII